MGYYYWIQLVVLDFYSLNKCFLHPKITNHSPTIIERKFEKKSQLGKHLDNIFIPKNLFQNVLYLFWKFYTKIFWKTYFEIFSKHIFGKLHLRKWSKVRKEIVGVQEVKPSKNFKIFDKLSIKVILSILLLVFRFILISLN